MEAIVDLQNSALRVRNIFRKTFLYKYVVTWKCAKSVDMQISYEKYEKNRLQLRIKIKYGRNKMM